MLHQRLRKAGKRGAKVYAINPVDFDFTFELAGKRIVPPSQMPAALAGVAKAAGASLPSGLAGDQDDGAAAFADALKQADGNAVIVLGELAENHAAGLACCAPPRAPWRTATGARLNRIPQGANAVGLARHGVLPGGQGKHAPAMLDGRSRRSSCYGIEPQFDFAAGAAALKALSAAKVVAFAASHADELRKVADVILPIGLLPEIEAHADQPRRQRRSARAPAASCRARRVAGWRVLRALGGKLALPGFDFTDLAGLQRAVVADAGRVR